MTYCPDPNDMDCTEEDFDSFLEYIEDHQD